MRVGERNIELDNRFNVLFTKARGEFVEVKKYADVNDTVGLMQEVIAKTKDQTKSIAEHLRGRTQKETCENVWDFCFHHLQYRKDATGIEQVRSPSRAWRDRISGVDCDCMTVFISSILANLGIEVKIRLTSYKKWDEFEHVYPVALTDQGSIIMDCVVHQFNYEVPYINKKDIDMKLQYLNGWSSDDSQSSNEFWQTKREPSPDEEAIMLYTGLSELEGLFGRQERKEKRQEKRANKPPLKERLKKGLNVINKLNPATALLRAGILASMKLNVGKVAGKLRYAYWSSEKAKQSNMNPNAFSQLQTVLRKLENLFYGAGGKPENLKKAILEGKGNRDKQVTLNGLGGDSSYIPFDGDLQTIIGEQTYYDEFNEVRQGINGLGELVSATTAIASASGIIATIAGLIKKIGGLFKKGTKQEEQEVINDNTQEKEQRENPNSLINIDNELKDSLSPEIQDKYADQIIPTTLPSAGEKSATPSVIDTDKLSDNPQNEVTTTNAERNQSIDESTKTTPKKEDGVIVQWIKDNPITTVGIASVLILGTAWAIKKYKESQKNKKELQGVKSLAKPKPSSNGKGKIAVVKLI